jgi:CMP/dCMP kinase
VPLQHVLAIDGPSGTGKSTVARALARRLGLRYLDTGAMYRAVTCAVLDAGIDPEDAEAVNQLARTLNVRVTTDPDHQRVAIDGRPVDEQIRSAPVTLAVSVVSAVPEVRRLLVAAQRELIGNGGIVVEGRDIGTVVAPEAPLKIFLTAAQDVRAHRRAVQGGGTAPRDLAATAADLHRRDSYDSARAVSPLRAAADAVEVDTSEMTVDEVIERLVDIALKRGVGELRKPAPPTVTTGSGGRIEAQADRSSR